MLRQKRKRKKSPKGAVFTVFAILSCAALAAVWTDALQIRERVAGWITESRSPGPAAQDEAAADGNVNGPEPAATEGQASKAPAADQGPQASDGTSAADGTSASGNGGQAGSQPGSSPVQDAWKPLAAVTAEGAAAGLKNGASLRIELPAGGTFSYRQWRASSGSEGVQNDTLIASVLFEAALRAGLEAGERHTHLALPEGVRAGFDVDVSDGKDLSLLNPQAFPVRLTVAVANGALTAEVTGDAPDGWKAPAVAVEPQTFQPERMVLISADRSQTGTAAGKPGLLVKVYVNGRLSHKDFYEPVPERVVRGPTEEEQNAFRHDGALSGS